MIEIIVDFLVPSLDDLVKEEVEPMRKHFAGHCKVASNPNVCLFRCRGIQLPVSSLIDELRPLCRVAMFLAELIRDFML